ncbi:Mu transposase C-terminal domain-containing protein [Pseudomonas sp. NY15436]|uniref:Mu transposase C-terminal domain-containing protein n=1 Tax=Pseudomonas sp. NY15436 TaxID=3400359 RepID=UPI003A86880F
MSNALAVGQALERAGACYQIKAIKPLLGDIDLEGKGGVVMTLALRDFHNAIARGEIRLLSNLIEPVPRVSTLKELEEARFRLALLQFNSRLAGQALDDQEHTLRLEMFCGQQGRKLPCAKTLAKYRQAFAASGFDGLIPRFSRRGGSGWSSKREAKKIAEKVIMETFMCDDKLNLSNVALMVNAQLKDECPSGSAPGLLDRKTVGRLIQQMPKQVVKEGRLDPRTFALWNRQAVRCFDVKQPFERVELDAKTIDMYCLDEVGNHYTQVTLYSITCPYASYPLAIYVCAGKPSQYTLLKLFETFFTPKDEAFKQRFGIKTDLVAPCALSTVVYDNAVENTSDLAFDLLRKVGMSFEYARVARGDDKGHVESLFGVLDKRLLHKFPGATRSQDKRNRNRHAKAKAEACYTVEQIYGEIMRFVADTYIHEPREKLGFRFAEKTSIHQAMAKAMQQFMPLPPPPLDMIQRLILSINRATRRLQHYGVDFEGFQYHSQELAELARRSNIESLEILYNPEDCSAVFAVHPDDRSLIRLHNKMPAVPAVSFDVARALRSQYAGHGEMTGHDYQRLYAEALARYTRDSQRGRRKTITENNREARAREQRQHTAEIQQQLEAQVGPPTLPETPHPMNTDEIVVPAPRRELSHG